jgi:hypothetical protein
MQVSRVTVMRGSMEAPKVSRFLTSPVLIRAQPCHCRRTSRRRGCRRCRVGPQPARWVPFPQHGPLSCGCRWLPYRSRLCSCCDGCCDASGGVEWYCNPDYRKGQAADDHGVSPPLLSNPKRLPGSAGLPTEEHWGSAHLWSGVKPMEPPWLRPRGNCQAELLPPVQAVGGTAPDPRKVAHTHYSSLPKA